jgi:hypothetical protein
VKTAALFYGFLAGLISTGVLSFLWLHTQGIDRAAVEVALGITVVTVILPAFAYFFPSGRDYEQLARERAEREAKTAEREHWLRIRKQEDELRRHEADTRKLQTEALMVQQRYEEDQRRLARNARARERRRQERGLPPEPRQRTQAEVLEKEGEPDSHASALDAILSDDDDLV